MLARSRLTAGARRSARPDLSIRRNAGSPAFLDSCAFLPKSSDALSLRFVRLDIMWSRIRFMYPHVQL